MSFEIVVRQVLMLAVIMALGFVGVKTKYVQPDLRDGISKLILRFTLPLLNLTSITGQVLSAELLKNAGLLILLEVPIFVVLLLLGVLSAKLFRLSEPTRTMHSLMSIFGNVIFLGYPLITALYGSEGLFYAIVYALVNEAFLWTLGVFLIAKSGNSEKSGSAAKKTH